VCGTGVTSITRVTCEWRIAWEIYQLYL